MACPLAYILSISVESVAVDNTGDVGGAKNVKYKGEARHQW